MSLCFQLNEKYGDSIPTVDEDDDDYDDVSIQKYFKYSKRKIWPDTNSLQQHFRTLFFYLSFAFFGICSVLLFILTEAKRNQPHHHHHHHQQESNKRFVRSYNFSFASFSGIFTRLGIEKCRAEQGKYMHTDTYKSARIHCEPTTNSDTSRPPSKCLKAI